MTKFGMNFKIPKLVPAGKDEFLEFWSRHYSYSIERIYEENIGKDLNSERVFELFFWKNGRELSGNKRNLLHRVYLKDLNKSIPTWDEGKDYLLKLKSSGKVWDIFWLHCINPKLFPIFDQHTYRAMVAIMNSKEGILPNDFKELEKLSRDAVMEKYFSEYKDFISNFGSDYRYIDKALFAYGKFLKTNITFFR